MSTVQSIQENGVLISNYDLSKIFIGRNRYKDAVLNNPGGASAIYEVGTLMGRVAATGKIIPLVSGAADGSQYVVGILANGIEVDAGADADVSICVYGDVAQEKLILDAGDTLDSVVDLRQLRDRIGSDTVGVMLYESEENTDFDNQ